MAAFRNVLKMAREEGAIDVIPDTPRAKQRDNPRPFFRFYPLVSRKDDVYKKVLDTAKQMAREGVVVRGVPVTDELYDIILFLTHSFVRPIVSELYAIKHNDVTVAENPKRLIVVVRDGRQDSVPQTRCQARSQFMNALANAILMLAAKTIFSYRNTKTV